MSGQETPPRCNDAETQIAPEGGVEGSERGSRLRRVPASLRPHCYPPGYSGNPNGRPTGTGIYQRVRDQMRLYARLEPADRRELVKGLCRLMESDRCPPRLAVAIGCFLMRVSIAVATVDLHAAYREVGLDQADAPDLGAVQPH